MTNFNTHIGSNTYNESRNNIFTVTNEDFPGILRKRNLKYFTIFRVPRDFVIDHSWAKYKRNYFIYEDDLPLLDYKILPINKHEIHLGYNDKIIQLEPYFRYQIFENEFIKTCYLYKTDEQNKMINKIKKDFYNGKRVFNYKIKTDKYDEIYRNSCFFYYNGEEEFYPYNSNCIDFKIDKINDYTIDFKKLNYGIYFCDKYIPIVDTYLKNVHNQNPRDNIKLLRGLDMEKFKKYLEFFKKRNKLNITWK